MHKQTGEVRPYDKIPEKEKDEYSEPFKKNEGVRIKGEEFRITSWREKGGRLYLKSNNRSSDSLIGRGDEVTLKGMIMEVMSIGKDRRSGRVRLKLKLKKS